MVAIMTGPAPWSYCLIGMGGCTGFDVVGILKKARADLQSLKMELQAERADDMPSVFTKIHVHFVLTGQGAERTGCRAGNRAIGGKILFSVHHAGSNRGHNAQF